MTDRTLKEYSVTVRFTAPYCCAATATVTVHASCADNARIIARLEIPTGSYNVRILSVQEA